MRILMKVPVSLVVVVLIISLAVLAGRFSERKREANILEVATGHLQDCDAWASMDVKQKKRNYKADPKRWSECLCESQECEFDRVYITGKLSR